MHTLVMEQKTGNPSIKIQEIYEARLVKDKKPVFILPAKNRKHLLSGNTQITKLITLIRKIQNPKGQSMSEISIL